MVRYVTRLHQVVGCGKMGELAGDVSQDALCYSTYNLWTFFKQFHIFKDVFLSYQRKEKSL